MNAPIRAAILAALSAACASPRHGTHQALAETAAPGSGAKAGEAARADRAHALARAELALSIAELEAENRRLEAEHEVEEAREELAEAERAQLAAGGPLEGLGVPAVERGKPFLAVLLRNQAPSGRWACYDGAPRWGRPTRATSFCTALVLPALRRAGELGCLEDEAVLRRAVACARRCALKGGAYEYDLRPVPRVTGGEHVNALEGSLGRVQVCNWGLASVGEPHVAPDRIRAGLEAFLRHHRSLDVARMRPIPHEACYADAGYFYLFGHHYAARAVEPLPEEGRERWHARLRPHPIETQREDGSTSDSLVSGHTLTAGSAYPSLALELGLRGEDAP